MSRRSSRLVSSGYYNSDEDSDSSTVTNVSYRENPVKVFKKKVGNRKSSPRTPARSNSSAASPSTEVPQPSDQRDGLSLSLSGSQTPPTMRTVCVPTMASPRPALTQTSTHCSPVAPEKNPQTERYSSSQSILHFRPNRKELGQSGVDSSGYSSSEGSRRKPIAASNNSSTSGAPSAGYRNRVKQALLTLMDSVSMASASLQSKLVHLAALANTSVSSNMKKACGLVLLLIIILLCILFLFPLLTSFITRMTVTVTKTPAQTKPQGQPVISAIPPPQLNTLHPTLTADSSIVSAAVEAKMLPFLEGLEQKQAELQQKQEELLLQMKEGLNQNIRDMKAGFRLQTLDRMLHMEQELAGLSRLLVDYKTDSQSAAASLSLRIQALEAQNVKLSQEWSTVQLTPPPAPCPDSSTTTVQHSLTPELQQAMEKWLTDRIQKEQDALRLADKGGCSDCPRLPVADRMADFALETQGASVVSTRCSETYRIRSACVTLFGFPLWYPSESPRTVIQGSSVLLPGKCWAFHGVQGTLVISLSHPITITHVTLDHLPRFNSPTGRIDSAPKDFEVYGMKNDTEEGTLLGMFTYDENGESTQTFELPNPSDSVYRFVELRVLSNWGHVEYTCLYRFRVHGQMSST